MPAKYSGLLDHDKLEDVKLESTLWKPHRPSRWSIDFVRPEFLTIRPGASKKPIRRTAWLDGLRGFAAFMVYLHHNQLWAHDYHGNLMFENSFGYQGKHYFAALPIVRHFFSGGHFAVAIFFVISGYVLSLKSLSMIQKDQFQTAAAGIGSALFRRWLRLYIPIIGTSFVWMTVRHVTGLWIDYGSVEPTYSKELWRWYSTFKNYSFIFNLSSVHEFAQIYNPHLWSIPIEFKGSIIIYTALSALARCTRNARLWCEMVLIFYFLYVVDGWYGALFVSGMLLCDLDLLAQSDALPGIFTILINFKELIFFHLFMFALYLGGAPSCDLKGYESDYSKSPGWIWLSHLKPQAVFDVKWFFLFWAAVLAVASVPRLPWLKSFFESRVCQYLGRISFALYLTHGLVIWLLADRLYVAVGFHKDVHMERIPGWVDIFPLSRKGPKGLELAFWLPQLVILPTALYAAEMVTKIFDDPSVKFSAWVYRKTIATPVSPE